MLRVSVGGQQWLIRSLAVVLTMLMTSVWIGPTVASASTEFPGSGDPSGSQSAPVDPVRAPETPPIPTPRIDLRGDGGGSRQGFSVVPVQALVAPAANPIALGGAQVEVYQLNSSGKTGGRLAVGRTGNRGATTIRLGSIPSRVLVKVTGGRTTRKGRAFGKPFKGSLTAVASSTSKRARKGVNHYFPGTTVNLQSTVLAKYAAHRPAKKWHSAQTKVSKFLGLPHNIKAFAYDYGFDAYDQELFNSASFLAQARRAGGVNKFVKKLAHDISAGKKPHPFPRPTKRSRTSVRELDQRGGVLTGATASSISNVSSIADGVALVGKLGVSLYDVFTDQTKNDNIAKLTAEFELINSQLADIITAIGTLQTSIDGIGGQISSAGANNSTTATTSDIGTIKQDWTQMQLVIYSALQVCDKNPSACKARPNLIDSVKSTCSGQNVPSNVVTECETFNDNLVTFNNWCAGLVSGTPAIQSATLNLANLVGGQAAGAGANIQGVINNTAQAVSSNNLNVISPSGLEYIVETWAYYFYVTSLGDSLDAAFLGMQLGGPLPGSPNTLVTGAYIQGQINTLVAPTMNMLAGTFPSMPPGTALSSAAGGAGTAYLWPTQIGENAPQAWNNNNLGSNSNGSPWVFVTNASGQVIQITNSNDSTANRNPILANQQTPTVSTLLPNLAPGVQACYTDKLTGAAPPAGTCSALIIGEDANGGPTLQTTIAVTSAPVPSWQVATSSSFTQLFGPFQAANPSMLSSGMTAGQWLSQNDGFAESLIAQGSSSGFSGQSGMFAFASGYTGFFGGCTPGGNTDCHLLTWDSGSPTGLRDLNGGYYITTQSGNFNSGCSGGGFSHGDWTNFANWTGASIWSGGPVPCGTTNHTTNDTLPSPPPLWNYLNGLAITPLPPLGSEPPDQTYITFNSNPYFNAWGLLTLFTAPVASNYCFASYNGGSSLSTSAAACLTPRTTASQVIPVPTG